MDLRNILVGTDFSPCSEAAVQCAASLAKRFHARLFIVHVISGSLYADVPPEILPEAKERTTGEFQTKLRQIRSRLDSAETDILLQEGLPSDVLLEFAIAKSVDLIVVGTRGHIRLQRMLLGSVAEKLSRQARCPVLVVPESSLPYKEFSVHTILCPTNFSERSAAALKQVWRLADAFSAHVILLHVVEDPVPTRADRISRRAIAEKPLARLSKSLCTSGPSQEPELAVEFGATANTIIRVATERKVNLIALSIQRAKPTVAHLSPEITFSVAAQAPCPVLTFAN